MGSEIVRFAVDTEYDLGEGWDWETAEKEVLRQFDEWKGKEEPSILAINFGREVGHSIEDSPHYCYIAVLFTK